MSDYNDLPPHIRNTPEIMWMAINGVRKDVDALKSAKPEPHPHHSPHMIDAIVRTALQEVKTPIGNLPLGVAVFGVGLYVWQPQLVTRLLNVAWPW